jgi:hypothetical protein
MKTTTYQTNKQPAILGRVGLAAMGIALGAISAALVITAW